MMQDIQLSVDDDKYFKGEHVHKAVRAAETVVKKWLAKESIRRLGQKLRMRSPAGRRRVKISSVSRKKNSVWYGLRPISLAFVRSYRQEKDGVRSGDDFYKGAFVRSISGGRELIWRRTSNRRKTSQRRKRSPNGTQRQRPNPTIELVKENIHDETNEVIRELELEATSVFREAFLDAIHQDYD